MILTILERFHRHAVRSHKCRIETDPELTDQFRCACAAIGFCLFQCLCKGFCAGMSDRTKIFHQFFPAHTDPVIGNDQHFIFFIRFQPDPPIPDEFCFCEGKEPCLINGICGIGDQFTQKNIFVGINGMDHQRKKFADLRLELHVFC